VNETSGNTLVSTWIVAKCLAFVVAMKYAGVYHSLVMAGPVENLGPTWELTRKRLDGIDISL